MNIFNYFANPKRTESPHTIESGMQNSPSPMQFKDETALKTAIGKDMTNGKSKLNQETQTYGSTEQNRDPKISPHIAKILLGKRRESVPG